MSRLGADKMGVFLRQHREDLTRIWRLARADARPDVFPGLLDDVIGAFFESCGDLLEAEGPPEQVWTRLSGLVRWPPSLAPGELNEEWSVLGDVLSAACESVNAKETVKEFLSRGIEACRAGTASLGGAGRRHAPAAIVTALIYSPTAPRRVRPPESRVA